MGTLFEYLYLRKFFAIFIKHLDKFFFLTQINNLMKHYDMELSGVHPNIVWPGGMFLPKTFLLSFMQKQVRKSSKKWTLDSATQCNNEALSCTRC